MSASRSTVALLSALSLVVVTHASDNGRARTPPMGWRDWNQFQCNIDQGMMETTFKALTDRSRNVGGKPTSLADLGYTDAGLDDCWQLCGSYGSENYTYHDSNGRPQVDTSKFPDLKAMTDAGHALNLTVGFYSNNCRCRDHCDSPVCFAGDVNATLAWGFDSIKLDGCGAEEDVALWSEMFNHSLRIAGKPGIMIENCHNGLYKKEGSEVVKTNLPYYENGDLVCPFHMYRSSTDIRPVFGSILVNLNTVPPLADSKRTVPGCWAYPDMLEVGVTNTGGKTDCGVTGNETCVPLSVVEARTHFGAWSIVSAPLVLGLNLSDADTVDKHWETITNTDAIDVNQDWAGFSGSLFDESEAMSSLTPCGWWDKGAPKDCAFPTTQSWYKPLSGRDGNGSVMAVLLMNNGDVATDISFAFNKIPGPDTQAQCQLYDVWGQKVIGGFFGSYTAAKVAPHDSVFLKLFGCE